MGKIQVLGDALGVVDVVERAAAMLRGAVTLEFGEAALIPKLHGQADDGVILLEEYRGYSGRVDTTGHGHRHEAGSGFGGGCCRGRGEWGLRGHAASGLAVLVDLC